MQINIPFTESPFFSQDLQSKDFTEQQKILLQKFADDGYLIVSPEIDYEIIDRAIKDMSIHFNPELISGQRFTNGWKESENVKAIACNSYILDILQLLYQRKPIPFQTLNFPVGTQQKTHSDMIHFNSIPQRFMCGVWVAFEDIHEDNGPLHYYPASHKLPFYDMLDMGVKGSNNIDYKKEMMSYAKKYEVFIEELVRSLNLRKQTLNIKKGQAIIWSANLLHGGEPINKPGLSRHSQVTHYFFDNCMYYTPYLSDVAINKIYLRDIIDISNEQKVSNKYFGEKINLHFDKMLKNNAISMLSKMTHLFPKDFVEKTKRILGK